MKTFLFLTLTVLFSCSNKNDDDNSTSSIFDRNATINVSDIIYDSDSYPMPLTKYYDKETLKYVDTFLEECINTKCYNLDNNPLVKSKNLEILVGYHQMNWAYVVKKGDLKISFIFDNKEVSRLFPQKAPLLRKEIKDSLLKVDEMTKMVINSKMIFDKKDLLKDNEEYNQLLKKLIANIKAAKACKKQDFVHMVCVENNGVEMFIGATGKSSHDMEYLNFQYTKNLDLKQMFESNYDYYNKKGVFVLVKAKNGSLYSVDVNAITDLMFSKEDYKKMKIKHKVDLEKYLYVNAFNFEKEEQASLTSKTKMDLREVVDTALELETNRRRKLSMQPKYDENQKNVNALVSKLK